MHVNVASVFFFIFHPHEQCSIIPLLNQKINNRINGKENQFDKTIRQVLLCTAYEMTVQLENSRNIYHVQ